MEIINKSQEEKLFPYSFEKISKEHFLVTGYFGGWVLLTEEELSHLEKKEYSDDLKKKLEQVGILLTQENEKNIVEMTRGLNCGLFIRPSLHMINTTNTCIYRCNYCHAGVSQGKDRMTEETALKVVEFIFRSSGHALTIEFQGGECLLNWRVVKLVIEKSRELNKAFGKDLRICAVTNLGLLDDKKLEFLSNHDVTICTSLDGTEKVHDINRKTVNGELTAKITKEKIKYIQQYYEKHNIDKKVDALATITSDALPYPKEIVDEYVQLGLDGIHLRPVQNLGDALKDWPNLAVSADKFFQFWSQAMDYIIQLNKEGTKIKERGTITILSKMLNFVDPLYVESMSPTGAGRTSFLYNHNGDVVSSDEGRMIPDTLFALGTVDQKPEDIIASEENLQTWVATTTDLFAYASPFKPWVGIHPVHTYQNEKTIIPTLAKYPLYQISRLQCKYLIQKMEEDPFAKKLFKQWVENFATKGF